ncbi:MAG TPA: NUDIX domain-containing protein, partial [Chitinophagaceae bacterium]
CSHPRPGESDIDAASRRLREELGFETPITKVFDFVYKASFGNGLTEYEFDHVFVGRYDAEIRPDPAEVMDYRFATMEEIVESLKIEPAKFTAWFHIAFPKVYEWKQRQGM